MLYIVATPIGNLGDMTFRAQKILKETGIVIAEDTRKAGLFLKRCDAGRKKLISFHEHNETKKIPLILNLLKDKENIVLISDAGTPCISDPGYKLIKACYEHGLGKEIDVVPGPCAAINALVLSGLPTDSFLFLGFLPRKRNQRRMKLEKASAMDTTLILFESPYRIEKLLSECREFFDRADCALIREMTKLYQEVIRGSLSQIQERIADRRLKGEMVLVIDPRNPAA